MFAFPLLLASATSIQDHGQLGIWYSANPGLEEPLERYGDDPNPRPVVTNRQMLGAVTYGSFRSVQVNIDANGNNIRGDAANEPSIAFDAANPLRLAIGWRQFDSVGSNFRQAGNGFSTDGGKTWRKNQVFTPGTFRSDPVLCALPSGTFFYNSLQQTFYDDVFRSADRGATWSFAAFATGGDKQWMTIDTTSGVGRGNLYQCWSTGGNNYGGRQFSRSTNGGFSWSDPIFIPGFPIWGSLDVDLQGNLYLCGMGDNGFLAVRSSNAMDATQAVSFDQATPLNLGGSIVYGAFLNPDGLAGQSWLAVDKSNPLLHNVYVLASVGIDSLNPCQVRFAKSIDGGRTFQPAITINRDAPGKGAFHWFGTIGVAPNGRIDVLWMDNRANPTRPVSALYYSSSSDFGKSWTPNVQISPSFDSTIGYPNQNKIGDYMTVVSDNAGANVAYSATFNGEEDIWFVRVAAGATTALSPSAATTMIGRYVRGTAANLAGPDGISYEIASTFVNGLGDAAAVQAEYVLPNKTAGAFGLKIRASTGIATTGMWWLYNWSTNTYDFQSPLTMAGSGFTQADLATASGMDARNYIDANGRVRAAFRAYYPQKPTAQYPFRLKMDQMQLLFG